MRFLFTLNMPPGNPDRHSREAQQRLVHQVIGDHQAGSLVELCDEMNDSPFILVRQWYYDSDHNGQKIWVDRGEIVINTQHIGKVVEHFLQGAPEGKTHPRKDY